MRIGIIGGVDHMAKRFAQVAASKGHVLECHTGHTGTGGRDVRNVVTRCDVVIVLTDVNSHRGVETVKRAAREAGRRVVFLHKPGVSRFERLLGELAPLAA